MGKRSKLSIIIESAEPREVHHFALLFGFGASAINPYLVNEIIAEQIEEHDITEFTFDEAIKNYNKAIGKGILKVMNKIGISTLKFVSGFPIVRMHWNQYQSGRKIFPKYTNPNSRHWAI